MVATCLILGVGVSAGAMAVPSSQELPHHAGVIVDTGSEVKTAVVEFSEDSISGLELLRRAGFDPETYGFSGLGAAVCKMCGKGCSADSNCLTCNGGNYWSYSRATSGTDVFKTSGTGASTAVVRDGDIDGWKYGTGGSPAFLPLLGPVASSASSSSSSASVPPFEGAPPVPVPNPVDTPTPSAVAPTPNVLLPPATNGNPPPGNPRSPTGSSSSAPTTPETTPNMSLGAEGDIAPAPIRASSASSAAKSSRARLAGDQRRTRSESVKRPAESQHSVLPVVVLGGAVAGSLGWVEVRRRRTRLRSSASI